MKKTVFFVLWFAICVPGIYAVTGAVNFIRQGVGADETARGSAAVASASGVFAMYWNPAGITRMGVSSMQAGFMYSMETYDRGRSFAGFINHTENYGVFGVNLNGYGVGGIEILDEFGEFLENAANTEMALGLSYANKAGYQLRYGATVKGHYQDLVGYRAVGYSLDAGVIFQPMLDREIYFGLMLQNIMGDLYWNGYSENITGFYKAGVNANFFEETIKLSLDVVFEEAVGGAVVNAGAEFCLFDYLFLRGGMNGLWPAAGAGFQYENYKLDYAFVYDQYNLGGQHQFSVALIW